MNLKTLKTRPMAALALVFFVLAPLLLASLAFAAAAPTGTISSVAWDYTTDPGRTNVVQNLGGVNVGDTVYVIVSISGASGVWGWCIPNITWDPAVLSLAGVTEGNYLYVSTYTDPITGNPDETYPTSFLAGNIVSGQIQGGVQDAYSGSNEATFTSPLTSGTLCAFKFTVVGAGSTTVAISGCYLEAQSSDTTGTQVTSTSATVTTAGFVAPEYAYGALAALVASLVAFGAFAAFKKGFSIPTLSKYVK